MDSQVLAMADRVAYRLNRAFADKTEWPYVGDFDAWDGKPDVARLTFDGGKERVKGIVSWQVGDGDGISYPSALPNPSGVERNIGIIVNFGFKPYDYSFANAGDGPLPEGEIRTVEIARFQQAALLALVAERGMLYEPSLDQGQPTEHLLKNCRPAADVFLPGGYQPRMVGGYLEHTLRLVYQAELWPDAIYAQPYTWRRVYFTIKVDGDAPVGPTLLAERGTPLDDADNAAA